MPLPPSDTDHETERVHLQMLRDAGPARRVEMAFALSADVILLARAALRRQHPEETEEQIGLRFVERHYGREAAEGIRSRRR